MAVLDLLGRRATLRVLWELRDTTLNFRALQDAAETNPSILNTRLKELREFGVVEHGDGGYKLTASGNALLLSLATLNVWAQEWCE
jgi:DNA-binding HxlR family transcriptional regulator